MILQAESESLTACGGPAEAGAAAPVFYQSSHKEHEIEPSMFLHVFQE